MRMRMRIEWRMQMRMQMQMQMHCPQNNCPVNHNHSDARMAAILVVRKVVRVVPCESVTAL